ncbi:MAG: hypothetical protein IH586_05720, partial [Anaerolineaceae bacterium]|nr:hypothetical protein [Anaerolineaceae bacterium]
LDMHQNTPEFKRFTPMDLIKKLHLKYVSLEPGLQSEIRSSTYTQVMAHPALDGFREGLIELMDKFGHLCDNGNDFSTIPWREMGDTILKLVLNYQISHDTSEGHLAPSNKISIDTIHLPLWKSWMVRRLFHHTRRFNLYRGHISYIYTLGYGLFRPYFLALGHWFVQQKTLDIPDDIFLLDWTEIRQIVNSQNYSQNLREKVKKHKETIEQVRDIQLPALVYGDQEPPIDVSFAHKLVGTPTSRGYCMGRIKVLMGLQDFHKVQSGDILVIPYSDVGWTPLFTLVAGVLAESGGMLSHSSIVAREYGIPAIVSVPGATRLKDGTMVRIDGYRGEVILLNDEKTTDMHDINQDVQQEIKREDEIASS